MQYLLNWLQQFTFPPAIYKVSNYSISYQLFLKTIGPLCLHLPHHQNLPIEDWNCFLNYLSCVFTLFFLKFPVCQKITVYIKHLSSARDWSNLEVTESLQQHKHLALYKIQWSPGLTLRVQRVSWNQFLADTVRQLCFDGSHASKRKVISFDNWFISSWWIIMSGICWCAIGYYKWPTFWVRGIPIQIFLPINKCVIFTWQLCIFIDGEYTPMSDTYIGVGGSHSPTLSSFLFSFSLRWAHSLTLDKLELHCIALNCFKLLIVLLACSSKCWDCRCKPETHIFSSLGIHVHHVYFYTTHRYYINTTNMFSGKRTHRKYTHGFIRLAHRIRDWMASQWTPVGWRAEETQAKSAAGLISVIGPAQGWRTASLLDSCWHQCRLKGWIWSLMFMGSCSG